MTKKIKSACNKSLQLTTVSPTLRSKLNMVVREELKKIQLMFEPFFSLSFFCSRILSTILKTFIAFVQRKKCHYYCSKDQCYFST